MNELIEALLLGIIQGLTEFLPVSSSGHIEIGKKLLGVDLSDASGLLMTVVLHAGTAIATIMVFRKDIAEIFKGLFSKTDTEARLFATKIIISMIPAAFIGLTLESQIERLFSGNMILVGICLLCTGMLLMWSDQIGVKHGGISLRYAFLIGIAQAIAILPGISRSGATIGTGLLLGIDRARIARFSFLMVVPLILGKMAKDMMDGSVSAVPDTQVLPLIAGFISAFVVGWFACKWMISLVRSARLRYFAYYCFIVGTIALLSTLI